MQGSGDNEEAVALCIVGGSDTEQALYADMLDTVADWACEPEGTYWVVAEGNGVPVDTAVEDTTAVNVKAIPAVVAVGTADMVDSAA